MYAVIVVKQATIITKLTLKTQRNSRSREGFYTSLYILNNNNNFQIVLAYVGCGEIPMYTILPLPIKRSFPTDTQKIVFFKIILKMFCK